MLRDSLIDLREIRRRLHLSQEALARQLGVSMYTVHRWERGAVKPSALAKRELALFLYGGGLIPMGEARRLTGLSKRDFLSLLAERNIARHYTESDLDEDLQAVEKGAS
jgi:transcriptional regulator with XRE-family HTH domain